MSESKNPEIIKVCVVIPAYNESRIIESVIIKVSDLFKKQNDLATTVVVVNDGSTDNTAEIASRYALVVSHILNSGAGAATATGLSFAERNNYDVAVTMDADGQHLPRDVLAGVRQSLDDETDLLIGSRLFDTNGMSSVKILGNKGLSFITYLLFGVNVTDSQSGLRVFSKRALSQLKWRTSGYEFCSEMLWRARQQRLKISEYPITAVYTKYSKSKGQNNWNAFRIVNSLMRRRVVEIFGE